MSKINLNPDIKAIEDLIQFVDPAYNDEDRMTPGQIKYATGIVERANSALENILGELEALRKASKKELAY